MFVPCKVAGYIGDARIAESRRDEDDAHQGKEQAYRYEFPEVSEKGFEKDEKHLLFRAVFFYSGARFFIVKKSVKSHSSFNYLF